MILEQLYLGCLAQASYLIGDPASGEAAVVDPRRDVDEVLAAAEARGLVVAHVILTHFHADFLAGHLELRERTGARIYLGAAAGADYAFTPLRDGDRIDLGPGVRIEVLETPGHTPESISLVVYERRSADPADETPHAVLTGDTLFIGDVGRPDLMASIGVTAEELAGQLYDSLHQKLLALPDETLLYPGHGAGSACGKNLSDARVSSIGEQRRLNYALQPMNRERFVELVTAGQPAAPAYFGYDARLNRVEHPTLEASLREGLRPLDLEALLAAQRDGAQVLDVRDAEAYAAGHLRGSLNVGLGGKYATWCGTVLDPERPIALVADPGREQEAALRLGRIGFDRLAGYLEGGAAPILARPELVAQVRRLDAAELAQALASPAPPLVLDVRGAGEREQGAIADSHHLCLSGLATRLDEVPRGRPLVLKCAGGYRSMIAASVLERAGIEASDLRGGYAAWAAYLDAQPAG